MIAGLPGTGLGGLFYILGALWMPVQSLTRRMRGQRDVSWRLVARQSGIAIGVLAVLWLTGWGLGYLIVTAGLVGPSTGGSATVTEVSSVVRWIGVASTVGLLVIVLAGVQLLRLVAVRTERPPKGKSDENNR